MEGLGHTNELQNQQSESHMETKNQKENNKKVEPKPEGNFEDNTKIEEENKKKQNENKKEEKSENKIEQNTNKKEEKSENKKEEKTESKHKYEKREVILITKKIYPRGLDNIGATCYMNSVLQCFYHVFELSNELLQMKNIINEKTMPMTSAFLQVIIELSFSKYQSISPYKFKEIISYNKTFEGYEANDSKNLCLYFMDTINDEFTQNNIPYKNEILTNRIRTLKEKDTENIVKNFNEKFNSIIADLFHGLKASKYVCLECKDTSTTYQLFNIFGLPIERAYNDLNKNNKRYHRGRSIDIIDCLKNEEKQKIFNGDNQMFCDKCNKLCDTIFFNKIYMAPKIMILFLDRGRYNAFDCEVTFPETLDFSQFEEKNIGKYHLIGVIEHLGPSNMGGHFIANCKHFDGYWYMFSDSSIRGPSNIYQSFGVPYLLFYRRE